MDDTDGAAVRDYAHSSDEKEKSAVFMTRRSRSFAVGSKAAQRGNPRGIGAIPERG